MEYDVFYMKPEFFRDGILGSQWLEKQGKLPKPSALGETHAFVKQTGAKGLEDLFHNMQAEVWSPNGEARPLIEKAGLQHTSMSIGDIAVDANGNAFMVDATGWRKL